jgi:hypothetical protein
VAISSVAIKGSCLGGRHVRALKLSIRDGCGDGSDIHVMLALRRRSRQVVVTNEKFNGPNMVGELLGKGQRVADQPGHALPQCIVEPFDVIGFAG